MTHAEETYKNDRLFDNRLKVLENSTVVLARATFNDLQALKTRINYHDDELNLLDKTI